MTGDVRSSRRLIQALRSAVVHVASECFFGPVPLEHTAQKNYPAVGACPADKVLAKRRQTPCPRRKHIPSLRSHWRLESRARYTPRRQSRAGCLACETDRLGRTQCLPRAPPRRETTCRPRTLNPPGTFSS